MQNAISQLPDELLSKSELEQFQRQARELYNFRLSLPDIEAIRDASKTVRAFIKNPENLNAIRQSFSQIQDLRNHIAQGRDNDSAVESIRPAYNLDEDDHG